MGDYQEKRKAELKNKFIDICKQMIAADGIKAFSVRKLADKAGYSHTSIYNYYESLDEFLWHVSLSFLDDLEKHVKNSNGKSINCFEDFIKSVESYYVFFFEKPHVFDFLFFHRIGEPSERLEGEIEKPKLRNFMKENLSKIFSPGIHERQLDNLVDIIIVLMHGKLLFYFSGKIRIDEKTLLSETRADLEFLLSCSQKNTGNDCGGIY